MGLFGNHDDETCEHPGCTCSPVGDSLYCSQYCEEQGQVVSISCECGHPGCGADAILVEDGLVPVPA